MLYFSDYSRKIAPRGFEPLNENQQSVENKALTQSENPVLAASLDKILQKHPDLAHLVEHWPNLPDSIKAAIKALVSSNLGDTSR
jgi:hypothetical protein